VSDVSPDDEDGYEKMKAARVGTRDRETSLKGKEDVNINQTGRRRQTSKDGDKQHGGGSRLCKHNKRR
jgi:hypothetical protein